MPTKSRCPGSNIVKRTSFALHPLLRLLPSEQLSSATAPACTPWHPPAPAGRECHGSPGVREGGMERGKEREKRNGERVGGKEERGRGMEGGREREREGRDEEVEEYEVEHYEDNMMDCCGWC